jgi:hypothetical protein
VLYRLCRTNIVERVRIQTDERFFSDSGFDGEDTPLSHDQIIIIDQRPTFPNISLLTTELQPGVVSDSRFRVMSAIDSRISRHPVS